MQSTPLIENWQIVVAFVVPIVVAALNRSEWPSGLKAACMLAVSAIAAGVGLYLQNALNAADLVGSALTIAVATIAFFKGVWEPTGITDLIEPNINLLPAPSKQAARASVLFAIALALFVLPLLARISNLAWD